MIDAFNTVSTLTDRQFVTGMAHQSAVFLPDTVYAAALDALVIVCVDCIPTFDGLLLLSRRAREPHRSWWVNGGRMRKGELYGDAASRLMRTELGLTLAADRFHLLGYYSLLWDARAQAPRENGCHTLSVTHTVELTIEEVANLSLNDEYDEMRWVMPRTVIDAGEREYHAALVTMVRDYVGATR